MRRRGWIVIAAVFLSCAWSVVSSLNGFLSLNRPVQAEVLIVESWLPDYALQGALDEFRRGGYKHLIAAASGLPGGWTGQSRYKTGAELTAATLAALGLETNLIAVMPVSDVARDRTYSAALGVKAWLESSDPAVRSVNLYSLGPHSRRSWLLYQTSFESQVKPSASAALTSNPSPIGWERVAAGRVRVGVLAHPDDRYDPKRWWATSEGFQSVVGEAIAYLYARIFFHPPNTD